MLATREMLVEAGCSIRDNRAFDEAGQEIAYWLSPGEWRLTSWNPDIYVPKFRKGSELAETYPSGFKIVGDYYLVENLNY